MASSSGPAGTALEKIRGSYKKARANARTVAALTDNPGCNRRRIIDAAGIRAHELAGMLGHPVQRGQSPFAIATGDRFEYRLKKGSNYKLLVDVLRPYLDLPETFLYEDVENKHSDKSGDAWLRERAEKTDKLLTAIAKGDPGAPHIVDHPVLVFDLAGTPVFLEPDALAFRVGTQLEIVEIKSYAVIDGQADPSKLSATAGQAAVYLIALRATLKRLGFDPDILRWSVILVTPRNFSRVPIAHRIPLRKKTLALQRVLGAVPRTDKLLALLPDEFTLDIDPARALDTKRRQSELDTAVRQLPMLYVPDCLSSCDMAQYCRHQAVTDDDPARLGRTARDSLAGVATLADALRLAQKGVRKGEEQLADVAEALQNGYQALERARARAPRTSGLDAPGVNGSRRTR